MDGTEDSCATGVCGAEAPPLVGSVLTGVGLTLDAAARRALAGESLPPMSDVQRRMVDERAGALAAGP
jgi:hypothetical protein